MAKSIGSWTEKCLFGGVGVHCSFNNSAEIIKSKITGPAQEYRSTKSVLYRLGSFMKFLRQHNSIRTNFLENISTSPKTPKVPRSHKAFKQETKVDYQMTASQVPKTPCAAPPGSMLEAALKKYLSLHRRYSELQAHWTDLHLIHERLHKEYDFRLNPSLALSVGDPSANLNPGFLPSVLEDYATSVENLLDRVVATAEAANEVNDRCMKILEQLEKAKIEWVALGGKFQE
ncbi:hypothetical protein DFP73DRAFT_598305 [Morchella snyderi]|nr:hypothetical protein DFP73DRAFT_598305 [Morchella snyderi]